MKKIKELKVTTNSTVYKRCRNSFISGCPICAPHKGCNRMYNSNIRTWKEYRKTQYKLK